jgi:hypothetical protein
MLDGNKTLLPLLIPTYLPTVTITIYLTLPICVVLSVTVGMQKGIFGLEDSVGCGCWPLQCFHDMGDTAEIPCTSVGVVGVGSRKHQRPILLDASLKQSCSEWTQRSFDLVGPALSISRHIPKYAPGRGASRTHGHTPWNPSKN